MRRNMMITILIAGLMVSPMAHAKTFRQANCTKDCSGHKAGYEWARKKGITLPEQCGGKSNSFTEGCKIWAKEYQAPKQPHSVDK